MTRTAARAGAIEIAIDSDPHAETFYLKNGAVRHGEKAAPVPGEPARARPQLALDVQDATATVVSLVIERDGAVLLGRRRPTRDHAPGEWETISGRVEGAERLSEEHDRFAWVTLAHAKGYGLPEGLLKCIETVLDFDAPQGR